MWEILGLEAGLWALSRAALLWQGPRTGESQSLTRVQAIGFRTGSSRPSVMGRGGYYSREPLGEEVGI